MEKLLLVMVYLLVFLAGCTGGIESDSIDFQPVINESGVIQPGGYYDYQVMVSNESNESVQFCYEISGNNSFDVLVFRNDSLFQEYTHMIKGEFDNQFEDDTRMGAINTGDNFAKETPYARRDGVMEPDEYGEYRVVIDYTNYKPRGRGSNLTNESLGYNIEIYTLSGVSCTDSNSNFNVEYPS